MNLNWFDVLFLIYVLGFIITGSQSLVTLSQLQKLKQLGHHEIVNKMKGIQPYLFYRVLFWPYYLLMRNPIDVISEVFFRHYGKPGVVYLGSRGLKNFLNDVFRGKNRYQHYKTGIAYIKLDKNSQLHEKLPQPFHHRKTKYAQLIYANEGDNYLLKIMYTDTMMGTEEYPVCRYDLDACERLNEYVFKEKINELRPHSCEKIFASIKSER